MGGSLFVATGNTIGLASTSWNGGEAILKLKPGPSFSGAPADYYTPSNWLQLDNGDTDIGTAGALPFDVGAAHFVATLGKDGRLHLADRDNLGGIFTSAQLGEVMRFNAPIAAKGRVYVAGNAAAYAFTVR